MRGLTRRSLIPKVAVAATAVTMLALAGCSSSGSGNDAVNQNLDARGPITYVEGKDTTADRVVDKLIAQWNATHPSETVTFHEQSNDADQQHDDLVQHLQAKSSDYDVMALDVTWTAEFAAKGWLQPFKDSFALDESKLLPATVKSGTYEGTLYAAPKNTNGGLLFYRKDLVPTAPSTWSQMMGDCAVAKQHNIGCYAGQYANYEGLTVNTAEAINANGGSFVGPDGRTPTVNTPQAKAGLSWLVDGFKNGDIPKQAIGWQEPESQNAFTDGNLMFLRNWPNVYENANSASSKVKGKFGVAPLPGVDGPGASTLGGYNVGINVNSKHKATALDFVKYLQSAEAQQMIALSSLPPVMTSMYDDPQVIAKMPYMPELKLTLEHAVPRPVTPFYPAVSKAIRDNAFAALQGQKSVDQAISDMQAGISSATS